MAETAGYAGSVKVNGASTSFTGEACTNTAGKTYQITDASKRVFDPATTPTVYDNGVPVTGGDLDSFDYLRGKITFDSGYTVTGPVTMDGDYFPMLTVLLVRAFNFTRVAEEIDITTFDDAGERNRAAGLLDMTGDFETLDEVQTDLDGGAGTVKLATLLDGRTACYLQLGPSTTTFYVCRAHLFSEGTSAPVDGLRSSTIAFAQSAVTAADGTVVASSAPS